MPFRLILTVIFAASFGATLRAESPDGLQVDASLLAKMGEPQSLGAYRLRLPSDWTTRKVASDVWLLSGPSGQLRFEIRKRHEFDDEEPAIGSSIAELRSKRDRLIVGPNKTIRHATVNGLKMIISVEDRREIIFAAFDGDKFIVFFGTRMRSQGEVSGIETIVSTVTRSGGPEEMVPKVNEPVPHKNEPTTAPAADWQSAVDPPPKPWNWKVDPRRKVRIIHSSNLFCSQRPSSFFVVENTISGRQAHMRFDVFDFQTGTETGFFDDMLHYGLPLLSEDGEFIAQRGKGAPNGEIQVVVSSTKTHAPVHTLPDEIPMGFAGPGRLLTHMHGSPHAQFDLWDVKSGQLLQHVTVEEAHGTPDVHDAWSISPGNRFLAVYLSQDMYLIDLNSGKVAARLAIPDARFSGPAHGVAFSPDGTRLAFYVSNSLSADASHRVQPRMLMWDLSNGKLIFSKAITIPLEFDESSRRSPLFDTPLQWFPDQKAWLLFGRLVVDIASGTVVYKFELTRKTAGGFWEDYPKLLLDGQHIMMRDPDFSSGDGVTYRFDFIRTQDVPRAMIDAAIAAASRGEAIAQVNTPHKQTPSGGVFYTAPRVVPDAEPEKEKAELRTLKQLMPTINSIASTTMEFQKLSTLAPGPQLTRTERALQQLGTKLPANAQNLPHETAESLAAIKQSIPRLLALQHSGKKRAENYQDMLHEEYDVIGPECKFLQARYEKLSGRYPN